MPKSLTLNSNSYDLTKSSNTIHLGPVGNWVIWNVVLLRRPCDPSPCSVQCALKFRWSCSWNSKKNSTISKMAAWISMLKGKKEPSGLRPRTVRSKLNFIKSFCLNKNWHCRAHAQPFLIKLKGGGWAHRFAHGGGRAQWHSPAYCPGLFLFWVGSRVGSQFLVPTVTRGYFPLFTFAEL